MAVAVSEGSLVAIQRPPVYQPQASRSLELFRGQVVDYATIYRYQPNVQTCVGFYARNLAQCAIHQFVRVADDDRQRDALGMVETILENPNPRTTGYRFRFSLVADLHIFGNALWGIVSAPASTGRPFALLRIPWPFVSPQGGSWFAPDFYRIGGNVSHVDLSPDQVVHFRFYNPTTETYGIPPLESLRQILAEEAAMSDYREHLWKNGARVPGVITRPKGAKWSPDARDRFAETWKERWSGDDAGGTPILEDGMEFHATGWDAQSSQYVESRKLTRNECAAAFFIPPPMVGILDNATFSNIDEQHKMVYQDTLAPPAKMITDDIDLQVLPKIAGVPNRYTEFNLAEKLRGAFEEQAASLMALTGVPILTPNEGRARLNLNRIDDPAYDKPVRPLNVLYGGGTVAPAPAAGPSGAPVTDAPKRRALKAAAAVTTFAGAELVESWRTQSSGVIRSVFARQRQVVKSKAGAKATPSIEDVWDETRWNDEMYADLYSLAVAVAQAFGQAQAEQWVGTYDVETLGLPWLANRARIWAENVNAATRDAVEAALASDDVSGALSDLFDVAEGSRSDQFGVEAVTQFGNFGRNEAAIAAGRGSKTWITLGPNARPAHAEMSGETVPLGEAFSNGGMWPGDPTLGAEDNAGCTCAVSFD